MKKEEDVACCGTAAWPSREGHIATRQPLPFALLVGAVKKLVPHLLPYNLSAGCEGLDLSQHTHVGMDIC